MIVNIIKKILSLIKYKFISLFKTYDLHIFSRYSGNNYFGSYSRVYRGVNLHDVKIGNYSYINNFSIISRADIGSFCSIGSMAKIGGFGKHKLGISTHPSFYDVSPPTFGFHKDIEFKPYKKVIIGHDVWIGDKAIILDGVSVGHGAIIAAGAVVVKDVPPYAIVGGNPVSVIRYRFSEKDITSLLELKWWDLTIEDLKKVASLMSDDKNLLNVHEYITKLRSL